MRGSKHNAGASGAINKHRASNIGDELAKCIEYINREQKQAQKRANDVLQSVHQEAQQATRRITDLLQAEIQSMSAEHDQIMKHNVKALYDEVTAQFQTCVTAASAKVDDIVAGVQSIAEQESRSANQAVEEVARQFA